MPSVLGFSVSHFKQAKSLPDNVVKALEENGPDANVILPFLQKPRNERSNSFPGPSSEQLWLCCFDYNHNVEMVLSCTSNVIGDYPVFIVPTQQVSRWTPDSLKARLVCLAEALRSLVPLERVYSVFAPDAIATLFSQEWSTLTSINVVEEYYFARLLSCTADTLTPPLSTSSVLGISRRADFNDLEDVARLCLEFSKESEPFVLDWEGAMKEADYLISKDYVWIHCVDVGRGSKKEVACVAAFTRNTSQVATISKVYTSPKWRKCGFAKSLVRSVCEYLINETKRDKVVLYVAHGNTAAARVYESVGFGEPDATVQSGHSLSWRELGFDREEVVLGHW